VLIALVALAFELAPYYVSSYCLLWHPMTSHGILWHLMASYGIPWHPMASFDVARNFCQAL